MLLPCTGEHAHTIRAPRTLSFCLPYVTICPTCLTRVPSNALVLLRPADDPRRFPTHTVPQVTDTCPCNYPSNAYSNRRWCCGDMYHLDLSTYAFEKVSNRAGRRGAVGFGM